MTETEGQPVPETITEAAHLDQELEAEGEILQSQEHGAEGELVKPVQFAQLEPPAAVKAKPKLSRLNNVQIDISVELGRKELTVRELANLKEQDVIELDKLAGEAFEIRVNNRPFAEGEVVVVTDMMAVRITKMWDYSKPPEELDEEMM